MSVRDTREFRAPCLDPRKIAGHEFEHGRVRMGVCVGAEIRKAGSPCLSGANERSCAFELVQRPQREREEKHCGDAGVLSEAKGQLVISSGLEQSERAFQVFSRLDVLPGEPMR